MEFIEANGQWKARNIPQCMELSPQKRNATEKQVEQWIKLATEKYPRIISKTVYQRRQRVAAAKARPTTATL